RPSSPGRTTSIRTCRRATRSRSSIGRWRCAVTLTSRWTARPCGWASRADRKSTRLNSSHVKISYAVFCLKKKKINKQNLNLLSKNVHPEYTDKSNTKFDTASQKYESNTIIYKI